jgi:hypothetical protein
MRVHLYDASVPIFVRYLERLDALVDIAESHARAHIAKSAAVLDARLYPDMLLAGQAVPPYGEFPATFDGLHAHVGRAIALLNALQPHQFDHAESRTLHSKAGNAAVSLQAPEFLFQYMLPNFFFHLSVAFSILRSQGIAVGKEQFDGFHSYPPACAT